MKQLLIFDFFRNFVGIEDIRRKYNLMVNFSKFTSNKNIYIWPKSLGKFYFGSLI